MMADATKDRIVTNDGYSTVVTITELADTRSVVETKVITIRIENTDAGMAPDEDRYSKIEALRTTGETLGTTVLRTLDAGITDLTP